MEFERIRLVVSALFDPRLFRVNVVQSSSNGTEVRVDSLAFDYHGAIWVRPDTPEQNFVAEVNGLLASMTESILAGFVPYNPGFPKERA